MLDHTLMFFIEKMLHGDAQQVRDAKLYVNAQITRANMNRLDNEADYWMGVLGEMALAEMDREEREAVAA